MGVYNATKYKNDFQKEKYDRIIVNVNKGQKAVIDTFRIKKGYTSLNAYINDLIRKDMNEDARKSINVGDIAQNGNGNSINIG